MEYNGVVSPSGQWLAYVMSDVLGPRGQIFVRPYRNVAAGRWQVSPMLAGDVVWARSSREVFFLSATKMMGVTVQPGPIFGRAVELFDHRPYLPDQPGIDYDTTPDGRFLMIKRRLQESEGAAHTGPDHRHTLDRRASSSREVRGDGCYRRPMFVIELIYKAPLADIDAHMRAHVAFLKKYYAAGNFLVSGRKIPRDGGIILATGTSRTEIEAIIAEDPFYSRGLAEFRIIEFRASQRAPDMPKRVEGL